MAERVLLPGDPGRALRLAQALTEKPLMLNHHRGLWGYTGTAADGRPLTVQSSGLGGPSTAAVVADLARLGARRIVRLGTCAALDGGLAPGDLVAAGPVLALDGTSRCLGAGPQLRGDPALAGGLPAVALACTDLEGGALPGGVAVRDRSSAAVLAAAAAGGAAAACLLIVTRDAAGSVLADEALHAAEIDLGRLALSLL